MIGTINEQQEHGRTLQFGNECEQMAFYEFNLPVLLYFNMKCSSYKVFHQTSK